MREDTLATEHAVNAHSRASILNAAVVMLTLGVVLLAIAAVWAGTSWSSMRAMTPTQATVVRFLNESGDLRSFHPVFSFVPESGARVEVEGHTGSTPPAYELGEKVTLYYHPAHPSQDYVVDNFSERWFPVSITAALGLVFAGIGAIARVYPRDRGGARKAPRSVAQKRRAIHRRNVLICFAPIAIGAIALVIAAALLVHELHLSSRYVRTTGTVLGLKERACAYSRKHLDSAVVQFTSANGQPVTFVQGSSSMGNTLTAGESVDVMYDPNNPLRAQLVTFGDRWGAAAILCGIGAPMVALGVWFLYGVLGFGAGKKKR
ncbi:DUF3592 domain-containing protein [Paraburkholderia acidisoli]|uniref:DUF3592 domain-containing protein n=1 Tax=Paraburkholderia acidisoli TaxID=2571748 RepID=A0A7Z2JI16_9BURK|nr:DUF3592 domain-containing protein [Paraburkholderia acidisoli]QGZ66442.1 DUF3592 domain-containing protein [Paraburkholderia acidisoli]